MKTLKKGLLLAIFSTAIIVLAIYFGLIGGNNLTVFAETQDCKLEQLEAFTNSDSFEYRVNDISYKGKNSLMFLEVRIILHNYIMQ